MTKRVIFDTNFFSWFCDRASPVAFVPEDEDDSLETRFDLMLSSLEEQGAEVMIPSTVLAEILCASRINQESALNTLNQETVFRIVGFGQKAAEEFGKLFRGYNRTSTDRNVLKFDLQILAIAKTEAVDVIYSSDSGLQKQAQKIGIKTYSFQTLPRPPRPAQASFQLFPVNKTIQ